VSTNILHKSLKHVSHQKEGGPVFSKGCPNSVRNIFRKSQALPSSDGRHTILFKVLKDTKFILLYIQWEENPR